MMTRVNRCLNFNHGRANAPVRFCPMCGEVYAHWERPTLESALLPTCPHCGNDTAADRLIHEDGVWSLTAEEETAER